MTKFYSYRWNVYFIKERYIKYYDNIDKNKLRPVLVISDNEELINRSLIVELSTKKQNEKSILFYEYYSKKYKQHKKSWILPDRIHTINRFLLNDANKMKSKNVPLEIRNKILEFVNKMLND